MARLEEHSHPGEGRRIRQARRESGLSQDALAERIGVPPADLYRYEEGAQVSARHLELIAVATGKPVSFLLHGTEPAARDGAGVGGRIRAVLAWLSETESVRAVDDSGALDAMAAREMALDEHERRLAERERRLAGREEEGPDLEELEEGVRRLEERENELIRREGDLEAERGELERSRLALAESERGRLDQVAELERRAAALAEAERRLADAAEKAKRAAVALSRREQELAAREDTLSRREAASLPAAPQDVRPEPPSPEPSGYNLDALEHALDERGADFPERAQEWRAYILFLREFVHADGDLPATFDTLVREVFRELLD